MAYGGGTYFTQNKILPGAYTKVSSVKKASATLSDRGIAAAPFELSWGEEGVVRLIEQGDFLKDCFELFGYSYAAPEMVHLREIFLHATKCFCYRLPTSDGAKAKDTGAFVEAKYNGKRGNDIRVVVETALDGTYTVVTKVGTIDADKQSVAKWSDLKDNDWVSWKKEISETRPVDGEYKITNDKDIVPDKPYYERSGDEGAYTYTQADPPVKEKLPNYYEQVTETVQKYVRFSDEEHEEDDEREFVDVSLTNGGSTLVLVGGSDGEITTDAHDKFLDAIEECSFNTLCCPVYFKGETAEETNARKATIRQYVSFTKRMREDVGAYFQLVAHRPETADYEGVIGLWNDVNVGDSDVLNEASLTYWLTGAEAGC
ncbi:MAG: phage tail sheath subtilisin-like domain-containing protein, partial [Clostridia bacterium]|nr:phage tail sheath subtilisin-like domain-containing protein [Clostridia bacterium]